MNLFQGDAIFMNDPSIIHLNGERFDEIVATTWLVDDHSVNFSSDAQFENVITQKPITLTVN